MVMRRGLSHQRVRRRPEVRQWVRTLMSQHRASKTTAPTPRGPKPVKGCADAELQGRRWQARRAWFSAPSLLPFARPRADRPG
jgi:hypothetical protein